MEQNYAEHLLTGNEGPCIIHYTKGRAAATRRQHKRNMLLTFITNANTSTRKRRHRTAPVKQFIVHTLRALFV